jgi:tetratricopeptide (TPR) repeat protein
MREELPEYVHARLYDLAMAMKDAHDAGSAELVEELYEEMQGYCLALINEGKEHAHLWETLGDFSPDNDQALEYYDQAMMVAERDELPIQSILIGMGERQSALEHYEEARELLKRGLHLAAEAGDSEMVTRADILLSELPS